MTSVKPDSSVMSERRSSTVSGDHHRSRPAGPRKTSKRESIASHATDTQTIKAPGPLADTQAPETPAPSTNTNIATKKKTARVRKLSSHETVYPNPQAAKEAFEAERASNPLHRRAPTPYTSRSNRHVMNPDEDDSDSDASSIVPQQRSLKPKVSFDSSRHSTARKGRSSSFSSIGSTLTVRERERDAFGYDENGQVEVNVIDPQAQQNVLGAWDPGFGSTRGIGPAGEAIEVIGLGRKTPRHRIFQREMLKPALRARHTAPTRDSRSHGEKPLPNRPMSMLGGVFRTSGTASRGDRNTHRRDNSGDSVQVLLDASVATPSSRGLDRIRSGGGHDQLRNVPTRRNTTTRGSGYHPSGSTTHLHPHNSSSASLSRPSGPPRNPSLLGSLFSGLSIDSGPPDPRDPSNRRQQQSLGRLHRHLIPAESLFTYLALAHIPQWVDWPPCTTDSHNSSNTSGFGLDGLAGNALAGLKSQKWWKNVTSGRKGFGSMGWEWHRRFALAQQGGMQRMLRGWEGADKFWERRVLEWCEDNVPNESIPDSNRWGNQIFALPADGFDTLEFYDEGSMNSGDYGLLSFLTGSLLKTAVSTLHMLRFSSLPFTFHLLPSPKPPTASLSSTTPTSTNQHSLWEGFGTLSLVNKNDPTDRSLVINIRPPEIINGNVMREFAKGRKEWWSIPSEMCIGDIGQANLLQSQVYDDCVQNGVLFWVVTNLKYWVFGVFDPSYTVAHVSPVMERRGMEPSIMQCLVSWLVRSVDERPQAVGATHGHAPMEPQSHHLESPSSPVPPYTQHSSQRPHRAGSANLRHRSTSHDQVGLPTTTPNNSSPFNVNPTAFQQQQQQNYNTYPQHHSQQLLHGYPYDYMTSPNGHGHGGQHDFMPGYFPQQHHHQQQQQMGLPGYYDVTAQQGHHFGYQGQQHGGNTWQGAYGGSHGGGGWYGNGYGWN